MHAPTHALPAVRREIRFAAERHLPLRLTAQEVEELEAEIEALEDGWREDLDA
ncbi:hypothetical protein [Azospirillum picis]|uniref:Uncharacterized protein n=1 Tax=Azospirillum picis TaxID=488438 RepID=A0ABU0MPG7_9PROT|nr:hypothetical protein [Azospirillum picis]MBP2301529.1 hypothetical protein [Azospirillum picis]MDQ0535361.1 hypothetical protein [Azospirillum picis]